MAGSNSSLSIPSDNIETIEVAPRGKYERQFGTYQPGIEAEEVLGSVPQLIRPISAVPMTVAGDASSDTEDDATVTKMLGRSIRETFDLAGPSEVVVPIEGESTDELFGDRAEIGDQGEEEASTQEEVSTSQPASSVARREGKGAAAHRTVKGAKRVTIGGKVSVIPCVVDQVDLSDMMMKYERLEGVMLRLPATDKVACSDASPEVCLYEHMFAWGLRLVMGEKPHGQLYITAMCAYYGLSPGQISANSVAYLVGFWAFMYQCMGGKTPLSKGPFCYFFEIKE